MTIGYTCQSPQPVIPLNFKTDNLKTEEIFAFFHICHTFIDGVDLMQFALKIRTHAVTIEAYIANQLVGFCACYMNDYNTQTALLPILQYLRSIVERAMENNCWKRQ